MSGPRPGSAAPLVTGHLNLQDIPACAGADLNLFFGPDEETPEDKATRLAGAKAVCAACPVVMGCLEFAKSHGINTGVWGGVDFDERLCRNKRHRMTPANTLIRGDGSSNCRACRRAGDKRWRESREEKAA